MKATASVSLVLTLIAFAPARAQQTTPPPQTPPATAPAKPDPQKPDEKKPEQKKPTVKETVVVSASKTEQPLVDAPATMTVIDPSAIVVSSSTNYGEILQSVPGLNVTQLSARDVNVTSRAATGSLATSELTVLDGRSLYQDFFGFTMWDFMPVNVDDIKRIEVIRGPASAVWGANAMNGVINVITKTPRESTGTTFTAGVGAFPRSVYGHPAHTGYEYYFNGSRSEVFNDRWSYRVSGGGFVENALPRPTGVIRDSPTSQTYPSFTNQGTHQPKGDVRFDYDSPDKVKTISFSAGVAGTSGIMHTGIGPFQIDTGSTMGYGQVAFTRKALHMQGFVNVLNGDATNLLTVGGTGLPIQFSFLTKTYDGEIGNSAVLGTKHVVTYGGNVRFNQFALSLAPGANHRTEGGAYVQDEFVVSPKMRLVAGARVDKFSSISGAVFSPRVAWITKPRTDQTIRVSYNRAFRAPSAINNNLNITIANPVPLTAFGLGTSFLVPSTAVGNAGLKEEHQDAVELSYTGVVRPGMTLSAAWYYSRLSNAISFEEVNEWPTSTPPAGWALGPLAWAALQSSAHIPQNFTYLNLGREKNQGVELGLETAGPRGTVLYANYSYQRLPVVTFNILDTNHPPHHRFNAGMRFDGPRWFGGLSASSVSSAYWEDVLDARFHGTTAPWITANGSVGAKFGTDNAAHLMLKVTNIFNRQVQQHVFGDVLTRQIVLEFRVRMK